MIEHALSRKNVNRYSEAMSSVPFRFPLGDPLTRWLLRQPTAGLPLSTAPAALCSNSPRTTAAGYASRGVPTGPT